MTNKPEDRFSIVTYLLGYSIGYGLKLSLKIRMNTLLCFWAEKSHATGRLKALEAQLPLYQRLKKHVRLEFSGLFPKFKQIPDSFSRFVSIIGLQEFFKLYRVPIEENQPKFLVDLLNKEHLGVELYNRGYRWSKNFCENEPLIYTSKHKPILSFFILLNVF